MKTAWLSGGSQLLAGYLATFVAIIFSMLSTSCVQALQGAIPDFQLSAIRSSAQGLIYFTGGLLVGTDFKVEKEHIPGLIYYGVSYLFFNFGFFGAATYLPLSEVQGIMVVVSFVFVLAQSKLLFKNDIAKSIIIASLVCAVGIVMIIQPPWMFKKMSFTSYTVPSSFMNASLSLQRLRNFSADSLQPLNATTNYGYDVSSSKVMLGYILCIIGGAGAGVSFDINSIILRNVKTVPKATYTMLVCTVGSVAFMLYLEDPVYVADLKEFLLVLAHSLLSAVQAFLCIYASSIVPGPSLSILYSIEVVAMLASQYTVMHSILPGNYNWIEVCGCIIVVLGACIPGVMDMLAHRAKANELP